MIQANPWRYQPTGMGTWTANSSSKIQGFKTSNDIIVATCHKVPKYVGLLTKKCDKKHRSNHFSEKILRNIWGKQWKTHIRHIQPETGVEWCSIVSIVSMSPGNPLIRSGPRAQHASHPFHGAQDGAMQNHRASVARRKTLLRPGTVQVRSGCSRRESSEQIFKDIYICIYYIYYIYWLVVYLPL